MRHSADRLFRAPRWATDEANGAWAARKGAAVAHKPGVHALAAQAR